MLSTAIRQVDYQPQDAADAGFGKAARLLHASTSSICSSMTLMHTAFGKVAVPSRRAQHRGFTLLEMIVVLVIIGLIMGLVGPRLFSQADKAKVQTAETQVKMLRGSLETMRLDIGRYPTQEEGLGLLVKQPTESKLAQRWRGPYLEDGLPEDPWGNAYQYSPKPTGTHSFALYSFGADGQSGGSGYDADIGQTPLQ